MSIWRRQLRGKEEQYLKPEGSKGYTVSSSRRAQGQMTAGAGGQVGKKQSFWSRGSVSGEPLEQEQTGSKENSQCKNMCVSFLCQKQVKCNGCSQPVGWPFCTSLQECLQEASIIDQEARPSWVALLAAVMLVMVKSPLKPYNVAYSRLKKKASDPNIFLHFS